MLLTIKLLTKWFKEDLHDKFYGSPMSPISSQTFSLLSVNQIN